MNKIKILLLLAVTSLSAQDWSDLKRYKLENKNLPPASSGRVVFMGNSITQNWVENQPKFFTNNDYIGRGISGQTTAQMLLRFRQDVLNLDPKIVVLLAGTNDIAENKGPTSLEEIVGNIESMSILAIQNNIKVVLCSVLPASDFSWRSGLNPAPKIIKLNGMIKTIAEKYSLIYLDYHTKMKNDYDGLPASLAPDGVHPNNYGYKIMSSMVSQSIYSILK